MGMIFSLLLCPITIPLKLFKSLMTLLSLLWSAIFIGILIYVGLNWKKVNDFFNSIASKIDGIKNLVDEAKDKIDDISDKVDGII